MEILVVLAILGLLAGLAINKFTGAYGGAQVDTARFFVNNAIKTPLMTYRFNMHDYPSTQEGLQALVSRPESNSGGEWRGPYLDPAKVPIDPWGQAYHYAYPGTHNKDGYDIWSAGPDKQSGTDDDIGNWDTSAGQKQ